MAPSQTALAFDDLPHAAARHGLPPRRTVAGGRLRLCPPAGGVPATADVPSPAPAADAAFQLGWDHARHGLVPPVACLRSGHPVQQGWQAGRAAFGRRTRPAGRHVRRWLDLRLAAWSAGEAFEDLLVTPNLLAQIDADRCPVTRRALHDGPADGLADGAAQGAADGATPAEPGQVLRLNQQAGHAAGHLAVVAPVVHRAAAGLRWDQARLKAAQAEARAAEGQPEVDGLGAAEWARLAALMSLVTPLPHEVAAALPLRALPSNRLRLVNPIQGLQVLITLQLTHDGFATRVARLAALLPGLALRRDFQLFFHTLLPRAWAGGRPAGAAVMRERLEDAWASPDVLRRWQRFASQLDAGQADAIVQRALAQGLVSGLPGASRSQWHPPAQATDGWALHAGRRPAQA